MDQQRSRGTIPHTITHKEKTLKSTGVEGHRQSVYKGPTEMSVMMTGHVISAGVHLNNCLELCICAPKHGNQAHEDNCAHNMSGRFLNSNMFTTMWMCFAIQLGGALASNIAGVSEAQFHMGNVTKLRADLLRHHDKCLCPPNRPVVVQLRLFIFGFSDISELNMDFTLSYYLRMTWHDTRMGYEPESYGGITEFTLHPEELEQIWRPDVFYRNERGSSISGPYAIGTSRAVVYSTGKIYTSRRLETTFRCQMLLQTYPFDTQKCSMNIGSYAYNLSFLEFAWRDNIAVELNEEVELTSFELVKVETSKDEFFGFSKGKITFHMRRHSGFYVLQVGPLFNR